jgi:hypothetical protein
MPLARRTIAQARQSRLTTLGLACLLAMSGCVSRIPPKHSTVTVARTHHVVLKIDGPDAQAVTTCSKACATLQCVAACPTAVMTHACEGHDPARELCRTFHAQEAYERDGVSCAESVGDSSFVSCVDNSAEREDAKKNTRRDLDVVQAIIVIPLTLLVIGAAAAGR